MMRTRGASTELQESIYDGHGSDVEAAAGSTKAGGEYGTVEGSFGDKTRRMGMRLSAGAHQIADGLRHRGAGGMVPLKRTSRVSERYGMAGFKASMTSYKTAKFHVVEDPVLAVVFRGMQLLCLVYAAIKMFYLHGYLRVNVATGNANVYAEMKTARGVNVGALGFRVNRSSADQGYCCPSFNCTAPAQGKAYDCFDGHSMVHNGCRNYKFGEVIKKKKNGLFVATYVTNTISQSTNRSNAYSTSKNIKMANYTRNFYVPGIEHVKVAALTSFDVLGYIPPRLDQYENGDAAQFSPVEIWSGTGPHDPGKQYRATLPAGTHGKVSLTLHQWMEYAGASLNLPNKRGGSLCDIKHTDAPFYRMTGYYVNVNLYVRNYNTSFLNSFQSTIPVLSHIYVSQGANKGWMSYIPAVQYTRGWPLPLPQGKQPDTPPTGSDGIADAYTYGVYFNFQFSGEYGQFDWSTAITALIKYVVILQIAPFVADSVMLYLMGDKSQIYKDSKSSLGDSDAVREEKQERKAEEVEAIRRLFEHYDSNHNNVLDHGEIKEVLVNMGMKRDNPAALDSVIRQIDTDGDNSIDLTEFTAWWLLTMDKDAKKFKKLAASRRKHWKEIEKMLLGYDDNAL